MQKTIEKDSLTLNEESIQMARETMQVLSTQQESLQRSEQLLDDTNYMAEHAKRIVKGMSWRGWIGNMLASSPRRTNVQDEKIEIPSGFICPECKHHLLSQSALLEHYNSLHGQVGSSQKQDREAIAHAQENEFLSTLGPQLEELKFMSTAIGHALDENKEQLVTMEEKAERAKDAMRLVTVKAEEQCSSSSHVQFRCKVAFEYKNNSQFLTMNGMVESATITDDCVFRAYTVGKDENVWGFQAQKNLHFLGITKFGSIAVQGKALKSYEKFAIDMERHETVLFAYASCLGSGGWICVNEKNNSLYCVRGTDANRQHAAIFKVTKLDQNASASGQFQ